MKMCEGSSTVNRLKRDVDVHFVRKLNEADLIYMFSLMQLSCDV